MKHILLAFLAVVSIDIEDSAGGRALISINYVNGVTDKLVVDKDKLDSDDVERAVERVVKWRESK